MSVCVLIIRTIRAMLIHLLLLKETSTIHAMFPYPSVPLDTDTEKKKKLNPRKRFVAAI